MPNEGENASETPCRPISAPSFANPPHTPSQSLADQTALLAAERERFLFAAQIGFDEKYLDWIFTVFQRLHGKSEYERTDIGLAVVRKIVLRHNSTITARSELGAGATFFLDLPVTQTSKKEVAPVG